MTVATGKRLIRQEVDAANARLETAPPQDVLKWALSTFRRRIALAWSGAESVAILDMMFRIDHTVTRVFTLDTGRLNPETYDVIEEVRIRYGIDIEIMFPDAAAVEKMVREKGVNLFYHSVENRLECCAVRKKEPLNRILRTLDGWITGQRRSESSTRETIGKVEIDEEHGGIVKVNPLADWTTEQVFDYIRANGVPKNKLHDMGFPSVGCAPCTRAIKPGESERAGRWWWEKSTSKECGIHGSRPCGC